ncbi:MAG: dihydropteroate synthase [Flavobacteriaceae bacterium]|jgi:dihydropteroate synthase|nr:dihydropteroate synthase [Flavobacteriaceae bacterium]
MKNIVLRERFFDFSSPMVMAIVNITPDSFFSDSRYGADEKLIERIKTALCQGADIVDIGAYSTRPKADFVSEELENSRICSALEIIRKNFPDIILSVDTFRYSVAENAVNHYDVDIINDISGGMLDEKMAKTVAKLNRPYILTHTKGTPQEMQSLTDYEDFIADILKYFAERIENLRNLGFSSDTIIDPGFGFAKTTEQNYELLTKLSVFECFNSPLLVGVSRKSMINNVLGTTPETALNGTTVINTIALFNGANILRVHDVKEAVEVVKLVEKYKSVENG